MDLNTEGLPNPFLLLIPMGIVVLLLNLIHWPAWAALFIGCVVLALMFWKRYEGFHKIVNTMAEGAKNSQSVIQTAAICGLASVVGAVPATTCCWACWKRPLLAAHTSCCLCASR